jgi:single-stranded-DNA-specific exonuclease
MLDTIQQAAPAALGVERSAQGRRWVWREGDARVGAALAQAAGVSELTARLLAARGVTPEGVADFLAPSLRALMPDPTCLAGMEEAAARLAAAVRTNERVAVFGDYDVDGACATALLCAWLRALGVPHEPYIPDRALEGYGPNAAALSALADRGATLIVCVDCGTAGEDAIAAVAARADVLVLDHHAVDALPRSALAVVNPNRPDCGSGLTLCAAGVTLMALVAANRALRRACHAAELPDLLGMLDLVALATVCDVMPLVGLNRAFVAQGLRVLGQGSRPGLVALIEAAAMRGPPDAWSLSHVLGPRINAGGRIGDASIGARLLLATDPAEARGLAATLETTNRARREIEATMLADALAEAETQAAAGRAVLLVARAGWHQGVVGIIASRLKERFNRPALAVAVDGACARGSGRGVPGIDLGAAVIAARQAGILDRAGGHAAAAGFGLAAERIPALHAFLEERLGAAALLPAAADLALDGALSVQAATEGFAAEIARLGPFGAGHAEPVFALRHARIGKAERMGAEQSHVRLFLSGEAGGRLRGIAFRCADGPLGGLLLGAAGRLVHLAGHLRLESWQGVDRVGLHVVDGALA